MNQSLDGKRDDEFDEGIDDNGSENTADDKEVLESPQPNPERILSIVRLGVSIYYDA